MVRAFVLEKKAFFKADQNLINFLNTHEHVNNGIIGSVVPTVSRINLKTAVDTPCTRAYTRKRWAQAD